MGVLQAIQLVAASEIKSLNTVLLNRLHTTIPLIPTMRINNPVLDSQQKVIIFPMTVDQTGCGIHNNTVFDATSEILKNLLWNKIGLTLHCLGFKGKSFFRRSFNKIHIEFYNAVRKEDLSLSYFLNVLNNGFTNEDGKTFIYIIFNRFFSLHTMTTSQYTLTDYSLFKNKIENFVNDSNVENSKMVSYQCSLSNFMFLKVCYYFFLALILVDACEENDYCSIGARVTSLHAAVQNTGELIDTLQLKYNKARQEQITNELLEVGVHVI